MNDKKNYVFLHRYKIQGEKIMATITLEYDGRNTLLKDLLKLIIKNGAKRKKTGIEEAMDDIKEGRVSPAFNNVDEMMKYLGVKK